jgi:hypothetical protein
MKVSTVVTTTPLLLVIIRKGREATRSFIPMLNPRKMTVIVFVLPFKKFILFYLGIAQYRPRVNSGLIELQAIDTEIESTEKLGLRKGNNYDKFAAVIERRFAAKITRFEFTSKRQR